MSSILDDIFSTNPALQNEPEVQKLIAYAKAEHAKLYELWRPRNDFYNKTLELVYESELIVIGGRSHKDTVLRINDLLNRQD